MSLTRFFASRGAPRSWTWPWTSSAGCMTRRAGPQGGRTCSRGHSSFSVAWTQITNSSNTPCVSLGRCSAQKAMPMCNAYVQCLCVMPMCNAKHGKAWQNCEKFSFETDGQTDRQTQSQVQVLSCAFAAKNSRSIAIFLSVSFPIFSFS